MNYSNIKFEANQYRTNPSSDVWQKLEVKLDQRNTLPSKYTYSKILSYAAVLFGLVMLSFYIFPTKPSTFTPVFEYSLDEQPLPQIYSVEQVTSLKYAYSKLSFPENNRYKRESQ
ncbi:MAG: hypothetical protein WAT79_17375 [Saprospiraceae bacterium]